MGSRGLGEAVGKVYVERHFPPEAKERMLALVNNVLKAFERMGSGAEGELDRVAESLGQEAAVAVMMVLGRYVVHGLIVNSLALAPPVPSIFEDGFEA